MLCPERRLYLAIVKQAIKDFYFGCKYQDQTNFVRKQEVYRWVSREEGSFHLCAIAWGNPVALKEKLLNTFERLDNGGEIRKN